MVKRRKLNARKVLIASVGVATLDYISACSARVDESPATSDSGITAGGRYTGENEAGAGGTVANLMAPTGGFSVANLVAPPAGGTGAVGVANLVAPPPAGGFPGSGGYSVANLIAPPPSGGFPGKIVDAGNHDADATSDANAAPLDARDADND